MLDVNYKVQSHEKGWHFSRMETKDFRLFFNEGISSGMAVSSGRALVSYNIDDSRISKSQAFFSLSFNDKNDIADTWFQELAQRDNYIAESTLDCKIIYAVIDDLFPNTRRRSELKQIKDFALHKETRTESL